MLVCHNNIIVHNYFDSAEFREFAKKWEFEDDTSSPGFLQSNGKAENSLDNKNLFKKCKTLVSLSI